ncbi:DUF1992 domain-containing protein [Naasia sp. SYSU D00948]|uniref:DnaJ family domain-containing protein n=1 Tax=Naasia sp. SYSU D00948 TaxID=2817379 RepID=UPI001B311188|nr:DUF1992 domain-containing protein [Naasia sp. SYSU D00948]
MTDKRRRSDSRLAAARYQVERAAGADAAGSEEDTSAVGRPTMDQRAQYVEIAIQQAMRRGDFDDLPGAGRPIPGLDRAHDPDWWIRRKIEREGLTGLGPPALTLRKEDAELEARIDALTVEAQVRELLEDFNRRVVEARRQLLGGPPVVTPLRDVDEEIRLWHERRAARLRALQQEREREAAALAAMTWRERRRAKRRR